MLKNVLIGLLVLVVAVFAFVGYNSYSAKRRMITDDVYSGGTPIAAPVAPAMRSVPAVSVSPQTAHQVSTSAEAPARGEGAAPTDSLPPQPAEGEKFGAGGRYQLYRQGDMTWRLNVETGESCIFLATDEEWHKERVYRSGCRGRQ